MPVIGEPAAAAKHATYLYAGTTEPPCAGRALSSFTGFESKAICANGASLKVFLLPITRWKVELASFDIHKITNLLSSSKLSRRCPKEFLQQARNPSRNHQGKSFKILGF